MAVVILPVFKSVVFSILNVVIICTFGFYGVYKGLLTFQNTRVIGRLTFMILLPCLLFDKLAQSLSAEALRELWIFPVASFINIVIGYGLGWAAATACRVERDEARRVVLGTCAYINCANLPLILITALARTSPFLLEDPTAERRGQAYIFLYTIGWNLTFLTFGERILYPPRLAIPESVPAPPPPRAAALPAVQAASLPLYPLPSAPPFPGEAGAKPAAAEAAVEERAAPGGAALPEALRGVRRRVAPLPPLARPGPEGPEASAKYEEDAEAPAPRAPLPEPRGRRAGGGGSGAWAAARRVAARAGPYASVFATPPFIATVAAFVVGLTPALRGLAWGPEAPLRDIYAAVAMVGAACIPVDTVVLAASLARRGEVPGAGPGHAAYYGHLVTAVVTFVKLVAHPAINAGLVLAAERAGLLPRDPLAKLVLLAEQAMPTAQSVATFATMRGSGEAPAVARLLLAQYIACVPSVTVALTLFQLLAFPS
eukprot:tig00020685_g12953.t1